MAFDYTSGNPNNLTGAGPAAMTDIQGPFVDLKTFLNARIAAIPTLVTSLPVGPVDGQEVYFLADSTNGVVWHLRYRSASASTYKWEFVGGPPIRANNNTTSATALATYSLFTPTLAAPLAGDYRVNIESTGYIVSTALAFALVPTVNAAIPAVGAAVDATGAWTTATSTQGETVSRTTSPVTVAAAGHLVQPAGRVLTGGAGNNGTSYYRTVEIVPVRVG